MSLCLIYSKLYPKPTVCSVYVDEESIGCVAQLLKLINFNQITSQKNSFSLLPTQQVCSDILCVSQRMSNSNNKKSQLKRKQRKLVVASTVEAKDQFGQLASAIGTPSKDRQTMSEQDKQGDMPYEDKTEKSSKFWRDLRFRQ